MVLSTLVSILTNRSHLYSIVSLLVIIAGSLIRLIGMQKGIWLDEYSSIEVISNDSLLDSLQNYDHPPLYFTLLFYWSKISDLEIFIRLLSSFFSISTIIVVMLWMKQYSKNSAIIAGIVISFIPPLLSFSQEIRDYPLLLLLISFCYLFSKIIIDHPSKTYPYIFLSIFLSCAIMTHLVAVMMLPSIFLYILTSIRNLRELRRNLTAIVVLVPTITFLWLYFFFMIKISTHDPSTWWMPQVTPILVGSVIIELLGIPSLLWSLGVLSLKVTPLGLTLAYIFFFAGFVSEITRGDWRESLPILLSSFSFLFIIIIYSLFFTPILISRTALPFIIPLSGFIALQICSVHKKNSKIFLCICLSFFSVCSVSQWIFNESGKPRENWKKLTEIVEKTRDQNEYILSYPSFTQGPLQFHSTTIDQNHIQKVHTTVLVRKSKRKIRTNNFTFVSYKALTDSQLQETRTLLNKFARRNKYKTTVLFKKSPLTAIRYTGR